MGMTREREIVWQFDGLDSSVGLEAVVTCRREEDEGEGKIVFLFFGRGGRKKKFYVYFSLALLTFSFIKKKY